MSSEQTILLGTRASALALWQANWVASELRAAGYKVEIVHISTKGDVRTGPIGQIGGQGVFTKEIQRALLDADVDLAVHSLKDLPTDPVAGLALAAVPTRESTHDVLVGCEGGIDALAHGARVGTGSLRRRAQLLNRRPDLLVGDIRGNVETRLGKLDDGQFDAIVLAEAGLRRLEFHDRVSHVIAHSEMLPAVGQGALGLEIRVTDDATRAAVSVLNDTTALAAVTAERAMLAELRGGCLAPIGAWARMVGGTLHLTGVVLSSDGTRRIDAGASSAAESADSLGRAVAAEMRDEGADELIASGREY